MIFLNMIYNDEDFEVTTRNELFEEIKIFYFNRLSEFTVPRYHNETDIEYKNSKFYINNVFLTSECFALNDRLHIAL